MAEGAKPEPLRSLYTKPVHPDDAPDEWWCACGEPVEADEAACAKCRARAHQRGVDACALCGADTDRTDGVCPACAADPVLHRDWADQRRDRP